MVDSYGGADNEAAPELRTYIIRLAARPIATYDGRVAGFEATSPVVTGAGKLDERSPALAAYKRLLREEHTRFQADCDSAIGRSARMTFEYMYAFNGMAIELTPHEAEVVRGLPGVAAVEEESIDTLLTDAGPSLIGADVYWEGVAGFPGSLGEGTVVAVIDGGAPVDSRSFADVGDDGYDHTNPLGAGNYVPGSYCATVDPSVCNDKVIGIWSFISGDRDSETPLDLTRGHGTHVASTIAGNFVTDAEISTPTGASLVRSIAGVAPHANVIVYDACDPTGSCPSSATVASIEQVVIDSAALPNGIQALNYSISGGADPYNNSRELAFLNAVAAGVYVSTSAGNNGPDASTVNHVSPWVSATAASTHDRILPNTLTGLSSDGASTPDLTGAGLTAGYGPESIVHARDFPTSNGSSNDTDPGQCLEPFPAGTWNGEIVACDRGSIARVTKGANVLAGGAGGFVLINLEANGESTNSDPHVLPGVHLGFAAGRTLSAWLARESNTVARISGFRVESDDDAQDIIAGFSSRGPSPIIDVIKPDVAAPGANILAADIGGFGIRSGTSMASPHHAGAALLIRANVDWTPSEVKSAMMMTTVNRMTKEDGVTPADPFDFGAGRIDLRRAIRSGLVLDETIENYRDANPETGGDPKTLNLASFQNGRCVDRCTWTRTVRNVTDRVGVWELEIDDREGLRFDVRPRRLRLAAGATREIRVTADAALAERSWTFTTLELAVARGPSTDLRMPVAVRPSGSSLPGVLSVTSNVNEAERGDTVTYAVDVQNGTLGGPIEIDVPVGRGLGLIRDSLTVSVEGGVTTQDWRYDRTRRTLSWKGMLDTAGFDIESASSPAGYVSLAGLGVAPSPCPEASCDSGALTLDVPRFRFNGQSYTQVIWSTNGVIEVGTASGTRASVTEREFPNSRTPNNIMAPFWTDLEVGQPTSNWYTAVVDIGAEQYTVYEWDVHHDDDNSLRYNFQVWIRNGDTEGIWFIYHRVDSPTPPDGVSIGVENADGTVGTTYYLSSSGLGSAPIDGLELQIGTRSPGRASFGFQAEARRCPRRRGAIVQSAFLVNGGNEDRAIAAVRCDH